MRYSVWFYRSCLAGMALLMLASCGTLDSLRGTGSSAVADCNLPDKYQQHEAMTPLPTDHDLSATEVWEKLTDALAEGRKIADRSNDKTDFVNKNCRPGAKANGNAG